MKFIHIADIHFDTPFVQLKNKNNLDQIRKLEQRNTFKKVIEYIKNENIEYLFIAGDLYENEHIQTSTIEYINNLFNTIPNTKIFITPGNHDPNIKGSIYDTYSFAENVKIFKDSRIEKIEKEDVIIYGCGFTDFYMNENVLKNLDIIESNKPQILIIHGDLNSAKDINEMSYNSLNEKELKKFDYVALGHIHKTNFNENEKIIYSGSLISLGFDELGTHGMVLGEFKEKNLKLNYIPLDEREFCRKEIFVNEMNSKEDLIETISTLYIEKKKMYEIILKGNRKFIIDTKEIEKFIENENIIKVKDETKLSYDLDKIAKESTLKGAFVRNLLKQKEAIFYTEEEINKAIEIGLEAME